MTPSEYYQEQKDINSRLLAKATKNIKTIAQLRLWFVIGALGTGIWAFREAERWHWALVGIFVIGFLVLVRIFHSLTDKRHLLNIRLSIIENEISALAGNYASFPFGAEYTDIAHPYSYDLDIFGKGSVYQALCRVATLGGAARLAGRLSTLILKKEAVTENQEITKELSKTPGFLQAFREAGLLEKEGPDDQARITQWLNGPDMFRNNKVVTTSSVIIPLVSLVFIGLSIDLGSVFSPLYVLLIINLNLLGRFQKKIKVAVQQIGSIAPLIDKYERLLKQMATTEFTTPWLKATGTRAKESLANIARFRKLVHLFDSRANGMTGPLMNILFLFDFFCLIRLENWRETNQEDVLSAMDDVIELDAYISGAVFAFNHPEYIYPEIAPLCEMHAQNLRHPLLSPKSAIGNDFSLGKNEQFYLLTGANMTGKSTFIRTVGVCSVLANMGLPLPAKELSLPLVDLYTSMRITDSVQDDISYFRAELNRIKNIMDSVKTAKHPYLILLDEPLRGTNSTDKQQGTRSIIETLLSYNAIGIVATHDTGLCDMEQKYPGKVTNYHFESTVEQTGLSFDFKIKPGGSTSNNATILMRQMGIIS